MKTSALKLSPPWAVYTRDGGVAGSPDTSESGPARQQEIVALKEPLIPGTGELSSEGTASLTGDAPTRTLATASGIYDEDRRLTFPQIHQKYEKKIFNLIYKQVGDFDDAEDLTAITFLNAYRAWDRFRGDSKVLTWLYQIALNNCRNHFTTRKRRRENEVVSLDDTIDTDSGELNREVADFREIPEQALLDKEFSSKLQEAIRALRPEYREALLLREAEGMSYEEIAEATGQSVPAIKTRLHRARLMVRQRLEPYYRGWVSRNL